MTTFFMRLQVHKARICSPPHSKCWHMVGADNVLVKELRLSGVLLSIVSEFTIMPVSTFTVLTRVLTVRCMKYTQGPLSEQDRAGERPRAWPQRLRG